MSKSVTAANILVLTYVIAASVAVAMTHYYAPVPISCVIRNNGQGWMVLDDGDHKPLNCADIALAVDLDGKEKLHLHYGFEAKRVYSLVVGADEAFVGRYHAGASVGLSRADIYFSDQDGAHLSPNDVMDEWGNFFVQGYVGR